MTTAPAVLISGAGIAGPALAYWMLRQGWRPILVERAPALRSGGHAVDVRGTALEVIDRMKLGTALRDNRTRLRTLSAVRGRGPKTYDVALRPLHEARGDREVEIMRDDLVRLLFEAVEDDVETLFGDTVAGFSEAGDGRVTVRLASGGERSVDLVVGADGQHSALREHAFGPERAFTRHLGAYLAIFTIDNILGLTDRAVLYNEPGRGVGMFTVRGNARAKALLLFRADRLDIDMRDETAQKQTLRDRFATVAGWHTPELLEAMHTAYDFYFDEMSQVHMPSWSSGRVALLGDAAFGPSPLSGQGTSLALIGAYLLAHHLGRGTDIEAALASWECGFRPNVAQNQRLATQGMSILLPASQRAILLRNQTVRVLPAIARLGRGFGGQIERASRAVRLPPAETP